MKSKRGIGKSRNARLAEARKHAASLCFLIDTVRGIEANVHIVTEEFWAEGRDLVAMIAQCFNEANAHNNDLGQSE